MTKYGDFTIIRSDDETRRTGWWCQRWAIVWIASSKDDLSTLPSQVKASFRMRLYELRQGKTPLDMKPLKQFGTGVYGVAREFRPERLSIGLCVVNHTKALYVLHAFVKKSKSGIGLSRPDVALIEARRRRAREADKEERR